MFLPMVTLVFNVGKSAQICINDLRQIKNNRPGFYV
jgi:hypothetical protein